MIKENDLCKRCHLQGEACTQIECNLTLDRHGSTIKCSAFVAVKSLCDTCIIKNCTAGRVVFGIGNPVTHCYSNIRRVKP